MWLTRRSTSSEPTICGMAFGDTKAPTSTVLRPAATSASMKAIRAATPTGVFSFCRPSRGPISMMRTTLLMNLLACWFDLGELDTLADDIADLAPDRLQDAGERRAERLLHFHDLERQDRRTLLQRVALFGEQRHDGARQGCD